MCAVTQAFKNHCGNRGERVPGECRKASTEPGTKRWAGIPGVQEERKGILGTRQLVPRYIKVSELGESSVAGGEGRQGRNRELSRAS